jgi:hypothetical protein
MTHPRCAGVVAFLDPRVDLVPEFVRNLEKLTFLRQSDPWLLGLPGLGLKRLDFQLTLFLSPWLLMRL